MRALLPALLLAGCATVAPRVDYRVQTAAAPDGAVPYQLTDTSLVIGVATDAKAESPISLEPVTAQCDAKGCTVAGKPVRLAVVAAPVAFAGQVLTLTPRARRFVSTTIAPVYYPDSLRLRVLTVEAKDHRVEFITAVGTTVRALAGVAKDVGFGAPVVPKVANLSLPVIVDLTTLKPAIAAKLPLPLSEDWQLAGVFGDDPAALGFRGLETAVGVHGGIATSICRPLALTLDSGHGATLRFRVQVADPDWLEVIPFPPKGSVTLHPLCGADVSADAVAEVGVDALAQAFLTQVEGVRAAVK